MAKPRYKNLVEYLNDNCFDTLVWTVGDYVRNHREDFKTDYIPYPTLIPQPDVCHITSLYTEAKEKDIVLIYCNVYADVIVTGHIKGQTKNDIDSDTVPLWLSVTLKAKFVEKFENIKVVDYRLLEDKDCFQIRTASTQSFVPYIQEEDLEYHAEQFLKKYYPEALKKPLPLDMPTLVKRMGLTALEGHFKNGEFGRCYFVDKQVKSKDGKEKVIKRGTIVCDKNACFFKGVGSLNNTVVHECVHWDKHRKFFDLMHLLNPELTCLSCTTLGAETSAIDPSLLEEYKWMEWQANALAPRILMPADMMKLKFEQVKAEEISHSDENLALAYKRTVERLADFFGVTLTAVKIRLLELGYDYLKGIHDYIDNKPTRPYLYNASKIKPGQSFSASFYDAVASGSVNLELRERLEKRQIVYASGFFVLNDRKYTYKDRETGRQELTDYALRHMDECCLVYDHERKNKSSFSDRYYSMCFLCRSQGNEFNSNISSDDDHNSRIMAKAASLELMDELPELDEADRLIRNMNGTFAEALKFLMEEQGFSKHSLMQATRIDEHKIAKFLDESASPSKDEVLALCAGMRLYPPVSKELLSLAGVSLSNRMERDRVFDFLLHQYYDAGLEAWDDQLDSIGKSEWKL